ETMQAFADVVRSGKAHYIGVSEWTAEQIRAGHKFAQQMGVPFISNQPQYSALYRTIEAEVIPTCVELGMAQVVWSPMAQGVLSGKYLPGTPPPQGSRALDTASGGADMIARWLNDDVLEAVQKLRPLADDLGITLSQMALAWVLKNPNVATALIGATRPEQIIENVKAAGFELPQAVVDQVDAILKEVAITDPALVAKSTPSARPA
ncbi:MAG: aldo/keto reductase, partial [Alphaproteobacteria bacterium]|nr:aldo/keto reductase [Alphaproteobacteria bacterium]